MDTASQSTQQAARATFLAFAAMGLGGASWASRLAQIRSELNLSPVVVGLVLLCFSIGSLTSLPLSGAIVARLTSRRTVAMMSAIFTVGLAVAGLSPFLGLVTLMAGFLTMGFATGAWDVAMNVQGAAVERLLGRSILPRFHAAYSVGAVAGALIGTLLVALHVSVAVHLVLIAVLLATTVPAAVQAFADESPDVDDHKPTGGDGQSSAASPTLTRSRWREPRTLVLGVFVLAFGFAEGTGNDWINIALVEGHRLTPVLGTLGYALFMVSMTAGRWFGPAILDRLGRVLVLRVLSVMAVVGVLTFVFSPSPVLAFAGITLWGAGASLGFPVGMSAAADEPEAAAARVSVVASIAYAAGLAGPTAIGFLGQQTSILRALLVVAVLTGGSLFITSVLEPIRGSAASPAS